MSPPSCCWQLVPSWPPSPSPSHPSSKTSAVKEVYEKHHLKGTLRVYGTPAEETLIGKVYMALDGQFNDLDACLEWHPGTRNRVHYGLSKALVSAKFTFTGVAAHAGGSPDK